MPDARAPLVGAAPLERVRESPQPIPDITGIRCDLLRALGSLSMADRCAVFDRYEARYGRPARLYAERMCGHRVGSRVPLPREVVARLLELVPPALPSPARMALAARLWRGPPRGSSAIGRVPPTATSDEIIAAVRAHYGHRFEAPGFSAEARRRLPWLAEDDIRAEEQVLQLLLDEERRRLLDAASAQIALLRDHLEAARHLRQVIAIEGHRLELVRDPTIGEVRIEPSDTPAAPASGDGVGATWVLGWFLLGAVAATSWWLIARS